MLVNIYQTTSRGLFISSTPPPSDSVLALPNIIERCFHSRLIIIPRKWSQQISLKRYYASTRLHVSTFSLFHATPLGQLFVSGLVLPSLCHWPVSTLHLLIYREDGGSEFLRNFSIYLPEYTASYSRGTNIQIMEIQMCVSTGSRPNNCPNLRNTVP